MYWIDLKQYHDLLSKHVIQVIRFNNSLKNKLN
jgi:hypothetical protein